MTRLEQLARFADRIFDRMRDKHAFEVGDHNATEGDFRTLRGSKYAVLVTYRRSGEAVPSPVWIAVDEAGYAYVKTASHAGKVKRIRNDPRVAIAPSNARGRPTGPAVRGTARIMAINEWSRAEEPLAAAYGIGRRIFQRLLPAREEATAYIELAPRRRQPVTKQSGDIQENT